MLALRKKIERGGGSVISWGLFRRKLVLSCLRLVQAVAFEDARRWFESRVDNKITGSVVEAMPCLFEKTW